MSAAGTRMWEGAGWDVAARRGPRGWGEDTPVSALLTGCVEDDSAAFLLSSLGVLSDAEGTR